MKLDLHVHTKYSRDGVSSPRKMVEAAKKKGLDGLAITDHNNVKGWKEAIETAKRLNLKLVPGEEIKVYSGGETRGELLCLFLQEGIKKGELGEVLDRLKQQDAVIIVSHPFDPYRQFQNVEEVARKVHGVEGFNARSPFGEYNDQAVEFAKKHGLVTTAGSDAHIKWEVGNAWTEVQASSLEEARKLILQGKTTLHGKKANWLVHIFSTLAKARPGNFF